LAIDPFYLQELEMLRAMPGQGDALLSAERLDVSQRNTSIAEGQAVLEYQQRAIFAERLQYSHADATAEANGPVVLRGTSMDLRAEHVFWDINAERITTEQLNYVLRPGPGRGRASQAQVHTGTPQQASQLSDITYTSCPPGMEDWQLSAKSLEIDHETGRGVAKGAVLRAGGLPLFYLPWYSFPVDDRRISGFLAPILASTSDQGLDITLPYYFNLAPNYDLTLSPRLITDRGLMLGGLFRYLQPDYRGSINAEYLPSDNDRDRNRWFVDMRHNQRLGRQWFADLNLRRASDEAYFEDFSDNLDSAATTFLRSRAGLRGIGEDWVFRVEADDFQTLDAGLPAAREPYRRLPRVTYQHYLNNISGGINLDFDTEAVYFDRDEGLIGGRLDTALTIDRPFISASGFLTPAVSLRHTEYALGRTDTDTPSSIARSIPSYSLDTGLFFDRTLDSGARQTLEPRMRYLYVPYRDQSDIPDFDTSEIDFSYSSLFRDNRFTGGDRVGDANQLALALGSRVFSGKDGRQVLSLGVGQLFYFGDRKVTLDDAAEEDDSASPLITEVSFRPNRRWQLTSNIVWDPSDGRVDSGLARMQYRLGETLYNAAYRYRRDRVDQVDLSFSAPINERWHLFSRFNYALDEQRSLETLAGFEYRSCCWAVRLVHRKYLQNRLGDTRENIFLQFELTGLGRVGGNVQSVLERGILGYRD
jgi:LPS-assembly protein